MSAFATLRRSVRWLTRSGVGGGGVNPVVSSLRGASKTTVSPAFASRIAAAAAASSNDCHHATSIASWTLRQPDARWFSTTPVSAITEEEDDEEETKNNNKDGERYFADLDNLHPLTLEALDRKGIQTMTEIQAKTWDAVSTGKDVLGRSRTGSGKTLAFLLPAMERILREAEEQGEGRGVRMLIISPTRELASQIHNTAEELARVHRRQDMDIPTQVLFGGSPKGKDLQTMDRRLPTILVATPGRIIDHLESSFLRDSQMNVADIVKDIDVLVLDEMDRLLDMGFRDDIRRILDFLPPKKQRQTLLFSATVPPTVETEIRNCLQRDYESVDCIQEEDPSSHTVNTVKQSHVLLPSNKLITGVVEMIQQLQESTDDAKIIVFFNTTAQTSYFASLFQEKARQTNEKVMELHSKIPQDRRSSTSERFRRASSGVLFTSDVSARGVDYPNVTHVLQIGAASDRETYIHRLGRTARAGKKGEGILVLLEEEIKSGLLHQDLKGISIPHNAELQTVLDSSSGADGDMAWLPQAMNDFDIAKKGSDCYRSLFGFYFQQFKKLGMRRPGEEVVQLINTFADQAGLEHRPALPAHIVQQYGLIGHPDITVSQRSSSSSSSFGGRYGGFDGRDSRSGGGRSGGNREGGRGGYSNNRGRGSGGDSGGRGRGGRRGSFDSDESFGSFDGRRRTTNSFKDRLEKFRRRSDGDY